MPEEPILIMGTLAMKIRGSCYTTAKALKPALLEIGTGWRNFSGTEVQRDCGIEFIQFGTTLSVQGLFGIFDTHC